MEGSAACLSHPRPATPREDSVKSILDPSFHYVPSAETDLKKTFSRIRGQMQKADAQKRAASTDTTRVIVLARPKEYASQR